MKTKYTHDKFKWVTCLMVVLPYATVNAAVQYTVSDLGSLGGTYSHGLAVNAGGQAIGFSHLPDNVSEQAIVGDGLIAPANLGTLGGNYSQAYGINNSGQVVGSSTLAGDALYHGFKMTGPGLPPLTPLVNLSSLVNTGYSKAFSINDNGVVTGYSVTVTGVEHAVKWSATGVISDLGTLNPNNDGNSYGFDINGLGQVAGYSSLAASKFTHGILWNSDGAKVDLGTLGGSYSAAYAINTAGEITGSSSIANDTAQHAFFWRANQSPAPMRDIGTLGGTFSEGYDITTAGDIVGYSTTTGDASQKAFLWQSSIGIQDLNTLIDPLSGWTLLEANGISDDGAYITGIGTLNGERHAFILKRQLDSTPPNVSVVVAPTTPNGVAGWYKTAPSVTWTVTDAESAISTKAGCIDTPAVANTTPAGQTFSCTATSAGGTSTPVTTTVIKVDTTAPLLANVPAPIAQQASSPAGATVNYTLPTATDAFSGVSGAVSCLPTSGTAFPMGATTVTCLASDIAGNSASASFVVTVADRTPPVVVFNTVPAAPAASGWYLSAVTGSWAVTDAESTVTSPACVSTAITASTSTTGQNLTCSATSAGGSTGTITRNVKVDIGLPTFTAPANITVNPTGPNGAAVTYVTPTAADPVPGSGLGGTVSCAPASGSTFPMGTTAVNCSVSDVAGNTTSHSFNVTVVDNTPPQVSFAIVPAAANGLAGWYKTSPSMTWSVTDPNTPISAKVGCVDQAAIGNTLGQSFSCNATSGGGTSATVSTPTLKVDTTVPTLTGTPASFARAATSAAGAVVTYTAPTATDTFSGLSVSGVSCLPASGSTMPIGTTTVTCSASDNAGNVATASFSVTVADQTAPVFSSCPLTVTLTEGQALPLLTATDNVSTPVVTRTPAGTLPLGLTTVTWTATDTVGLSASCIQQVTVNPAITETITTTSGKVQCKRINATSGEWLVQGTSSITTNNRIQLYLAGTVPADLTSNTLGASVPVSSNGSGWQFQAKPGPACTSPISLRSTAGTVKENIAVTVQ